MRKFFNKSKFNILIYDLIFVVFNILLNFLLYLLNMRFRLWFIVIIVLISIIGFIIGMFKVLYNSYEDKKTVIIFSMLSVITILIFIALLLPIIGFIGIFTYKPEHTVELDNKKYVAVVNSLFHVNVNYYDYYGPLLMGTKVKVYGYFGNGDYDPFNNPNIVGNVEYTYYDDKGKIKYKRTVNFIKDGNGNIIDNNSNDIDINPPKYNENDRYLLPEDEEVLYEKKFGKTILRFTRVDYILGQRSLVRVLRSKDNGKNFYVVSDDVIQVSNEAKFIFLNENLGFAISNGKIYLSSNSVPGLYVTNDGGKTFESSKFKYENEDVEYINIKDFPYYDKGILKIKCLVYEFNTSKDSYENKELIFISKDNGLNWILQQ